MQVELVRATTRDGLRLDGMLIAGTDPASAHFDAVIMLHGLGGNFYGSTLMEKIGAACWKMGSNVLHVNTRGHDGLYTAVVGLQQVWLGAAFERVDYCTRDLQAWVDLLRERGIERIGLVGHSLGAIKALYAQAREPMAEVTGIVAISASRLSYEQFMASERREEFRQVLAAAQAKLDQSAPGDLIHASFPFPTFISAEMYLDKYGPANRYNWLNFIDKIEVPVLFTFGERELESNAAFQGILDDFYQLGLAHDRFSVSTIASADHFYTGRHEALCEAIQGWLASQGTPGGPGAK